MHPLPCECCGDTGDVRWFEEEEGNFLALCADYAACRERFHAQMDALETQVARDWAPAEAREEIQF